MRNNFLKIKKNSQKIPGTSITWVSGTYSRELSGPTKMTNNNYVKRNIEARSRNHC